MPGKKRKDRGPGDKPGASPVSGAGTAETRGLTLTATQQDLLLVGTFAVLTIILFWDFVFSNLMLFGSDIMPSGYTAHKAFTEFLVSGAGIPVWNPYILGGLPFVEALHGPILYPASVLNLFLPVHRFFGVKFVLHVFLAGLCMFAFLRARGLGRPASAVGGLGYMFAPYLVSLIYAGHDAKLYVAALLPLAFYCLEKGFRTGRAFYSVMLGGSVGLMFLTSHVQMSAYALWALGLYFLFRVVGAGRETGSWRSCVRPTLLFALGMGVGFAIGLVQFLPSYIYTSGFSPRAGGVTYEFATSWSLHPEEILSLAVPEFVHYLDGYWGRNAFKLNCEAPGLIVLVLAGIALCGRWSRRAGVVFLVSLVLFFLSMLTGSLLQAVLVLLSLAGFVFCVIRARDLGFYLLLALFALFYSVGAHTPLYRIFFHLIPGVKFFRAPSTIMMLFLFCTAALAGMGADRFLSAEDPVERRQRLRNLLWATLAGAVLLIALAVGREAVMDLWGRSVYPDLGGRRAVLEANYPEFLRGLALGIALLAGVALCAWLVSSSPARSRWSAAGLGVLVLISAWPVDRDFIRCVRLEDFVRRDPIIQHMETDRELFRVLPWTGGSMYDRNYLPIFGLQTVNGFHDNRLRIYDELTADNRLLHPRILDLYNTKYVVTTQPVGGDALEEVLVSGQLHLYRNRGALPRAFVAFNYEVIPDSAGIIERLLDPDFDYRSTLILGEAPPGLVPEPGRGPVPAEILSYGPNEIRVRTRTEVPGLLFVGDNYFPYWRASIDGEGVPVLRCDYALRAIPVPAGVQEVVLRYRSAPLMAGGLTSSLAGVLVLSWLGVHLVRRSRGRREHRE